MSLIMKIKLTNTWKHLAIGAICGLLFYLIQLIPGLWQLEYFGFFVFFALTVGWENAQYQRRSKSKPWNWLDSIIDILAGNAGFHALYWLLGALI